MNYLIKDELYRIGDLLQFLNANFSGADVTVGRFRIFDTNGKALCAIDYNEAGYVMVPVRS
jgi:hypothetical protein